MENLATDKQAARLSAHASQLGLRGTVYARNTNGVGWRYQWCPPDAAKTAGLGDSYREARQALDSMAREAELAARTARALLDGYVIPTDDGPPWEITVRVPDGASWAQCAAIAEEHELTLYAPGDAFRSVHSMLGRHTIATEILLADEEFIWALRDGKPTDVDFDDVSQLNPASLRSSSSTTRTEEERGTVKRSTVPIPSPVKGREGSGPER